MLTEAIIVGMTPEQFWDEDPSLYFNYIDAYNKIKTNEAEADVEKINFTAWLTGLYVDYALKINHPLANKAGDYLKEPIAMGDKKVEEVKHDNKYTEEELEKFEEQKMLRQFEQFGKYATAYNKEYFGVEEGE